MKNESFNKKRILGLDIGVASVGWAVVEEYEQDKWTLHDFGVRMFEHPIDNKKNISLAEQRRMIRSRRRLVRRKQERIKRLKKLFENFSLVKVEEIDNHFKKMNDKKNSDYKYCDEFNPYVIRYKAIQGEKINPLQLLIALINISKSRGYDDTFIKIEELKNNKEDENGINYKNSILYGNQLIDEYKYPIIALSNVKIGKEGAKISINNEFFITGNRNFAKKGKIHDPFYFPRYSYVDEVKEILNKQKKNLNLSDEFIKLVAGDDNEIRNNSVIFSQRSFEEGPGKTDIDNDKRIYKGFLDKLGKDIFYNEPRMWKSCLEGDLFFIISELSKISVPNTTKDILKNVFSDVYNSYVDNKTNLFLNEKKDVEW